MVKKQTSNSVELTSKPTINFMEGTSFHQLFGNAWLLWDIPEHHPLQHPCLIEFNHNLPKPPERTTIYSVGKQWKQLVSWLFAGMGRVTDSKSSLATRRNCVIPSSLPRPIIQEYDTITKQYD
ncbi:hypothetical protein HMPREF2811_06420 [Globicatella sp. HMSC072A10]|nr:hypothetical protein HMPREF2811_06420 [Globicatella sp. HMSC072A10]